MSSALALTPTLDPDARIPSVQIYDNHIPRSDAVKISVLIPTFRDAPSDLLDALGAVKDSPAFEVIVYDDGSAEPELTNALIASAERANSAVRIITAARNAGRATARNTLAEHARGDWLLFLDADMKPANHDFMTRYFSAIATTPNPALIVGGYELPDMLIEGEYALHAWQSARSECVPAERRRRAPGRFVFSCNILAHRKVLDACPFDPGFRGWGWEDTEWGVRVAKDFEVVHIDNPAIHFGLDTDKTLIAKYSDSVANFRRLLEQQPEAMHDSPLMKATLLAKRLPCRPFLRKFLLGLARKRKFPIHLRGFALKAWRAIIYVEALD